MTGLKYPETVCNFCRKPTKGKNIRKRTIKEDEDEDSTSLLHNQKKALKPDNGLCFSTASSKSASDKLILQFPSSKQIQYQNDSRATATLETETELTKDARALKRAEEALKGKNTSSGEDKLYTGMHGYADHKAGFRREQTGGSHGPLRASAHIRVSARFDYQPEICKDFKQTGFCGYGDSCKFMHDRGDYKSGWQIEKDWEEAEKARKRQIWL